MILIKKAIFWGFATQLVIWSVYTLFPSDSLDWVAQPGFLISQLAGEEVAIAFILVINWLLYAAVWLALLSLVVFLYPQMLPAKLSDPYDRLRGYYEA
jgi:hypothetical protein